MLFKTFPAFLLEVLQKMCYTDGAKEKAALAAYPEKGAEMANYDDLYYDTYNEGEAPEEESRGARIGKIVLRAAAVTLILGMLFFLFYRMWEMRTPRSVGDYIWTESAAQIYDELKNSEKKVRAEYAGSDYSFEKEDLTTVTLTKKGATPDAYETVILPAAEYYENTALFRVFTPNTGSYTDTDKDGNPVTVTRTGYYDVAGSPIEGAIRLSNCYLVPAAKQVQLTFRYKTDTLEKLGGKTGMDGSVFVYTLKDAAGVSYRSYRYKTAQRGVYRYLTMVFEEVELSSVSQLDLVFEYRTEKDTIESLSVNVYDARLPIPVNEIAVKKSDAQTLPRYSPAD